MRIVTVPISRARWVWLLLSLAALSITTVACTDGYGYATEAPGELGGGTISVVASFYPLAEATEEIGGDGVGVSNLTPPGVEPHDLELTPAQIEAIATADVVLYVGRGFQPAVEEAVATIAEGETVDVLEGLASEQATAAEQREGDLALDPHVWLSPVLMREVVRTISASLSAVDPNRAQAFEAGAAAYAERLDALDREYRAGLADCRRNVIVTSHAAFGYLARDYGLRQLAIAGVSPDDEPDARSLDAVAEEVRRTGATTIFTEELVSPKTAETVASETGATTAVLSPIEGLTQEQIEAGEDYASRMRANLAALQEGLGCRS